MGNHIKNLITFIFTFFLCFFIASIILSILLCIFAHLHHMGLISTTEKIGSNVEFTYTYYVSMIILTLSLIIVAWIQLKSLNETSKADFLLRIDTRYGSNEIIAARAIIQRLYRKANPSDKHVTEEQYFQIIADGIDEIRKDEFPKSCEEFSYLLNLLDFLETISYFSRKNYITVNDVDELIGNSIIFYYKIYKRWIYYRRCTYNNPSYYCEFERLVEKLESHQAKEKLAQTCPILRFINYFD